MMATLHPQDNAADLISPHNSLEYADNFNVKRKVDEALNGRTKKNHQIVVPRV
jgi:hypothetical protein